MPVSPKGIAYEVFPFFWQIFIFYFARVVGHAPITKILPDPKAVAVFGLRWIVVPSGNVAEIFQSVGLLVHKVGPAQASQNVGHMLAATKRYESTDDPCLLTAA